MGKKNRTYDLSKIKIGSDPLLIYSELCGPLSIGEVTKLETRKDKEGNVWIEWQGKTHPWVNVDEIKKLPKEVQIEFEVEEENGQTM